MGTVLGLAGEESYNMLNNDTLWKNAL